MRPRGGAGPPPREPMTIAIAILTVMSIVPSTAPAASLGPFSATPDGNELVEAQLALDQPALSPGATADLGVIFRIESGWHMYWRNPGDTGFPPTVKLDLPEGVVAGPILWPAPERYEHTGMVDFIYHPDVMLILPLTISPDFRGEEIEIHASLEWLVCKTECLMGSRQVSLRAPVGATPTQSPVAETTARMFAQTRTRLPLPAPAASRDGVTHTWQGRTLIIRAPGADALTFFHDRTRGADPVLAVRDGHTESDTLRIEYADGVDRAAQVTGVLAVHRGGKKHYYELRIPGPGERR